MYKEQAAIKLFEAEAHLEATLFKGLPAPKFGTRERAEFDVQNRGKISKARRIYDAREKLKQAREEYERENK